MNINTANFFKLTSAFLVGLLIGILTIQLIGYFQHGNVVNILEDLRVNKFRVENILILIYAGIVGIMGGLLFTQRDSLKNQRKRILLLKEETKNKDKLLGFAAHGLRTPATGLKWAINAILEGSYGALAQQQKQIFKDIYNSIETLISLIGDYVDISKFKLRRLEASLKRVTIGSMEEKIRKKVKVHQGFSEEERVKVTYSSSILETQKKQITLADLPRLIRVIDNLVQNAIDYTPEKGKVHIETSVTANTFLFQVSDTGIGIPKQDKNKVFSEFFRSINARKLKSTGSGIGLFLASMVIKAHKGKIWFDSEENKGTTFHFQIPLYQQASAENLEEFLRKV